MIGFWMETTKLSLIEVPYHLQQKGVSVGKGPGDEKTSGLAARLVGAIAVAARKNSKAGDTE